MADQPTRLHSDRNKRAQKPDLKTAQSAPDAIPSVLPAAEPAVGAATPGPEPMRWSKVDLGPELPMAVFTSMEVWNPERIGAVALYCSDGRWGEAFDEFCQKRLHIPRYDRLAVPGGPACLVPQDKDPCSLVDAARKQLSLLVRVHELERIVLISHYGCAMYAERLQKDPDGCLPTQLEDLGTAAKTLRDWFPEVQVETYLAMRKESRLSFHWVNA
jgi:hypothetical protein